MRTIAIGDIHGCAVALRALLQSLDLHGDRLIFLGDYIDRGPDSSQVIETLLGLSFNPNHVFLRGNHDHRSFMIFYLPNRTTIRHSIDLGLIVLEYHERRAIFADSFSRFINGGEEIETNALGADSLGKHRHHAGVGDTEKHGTLRQRRLYGSSC